MDSKRFEQVVKNRTGATVKADEFGTKLNVLVLDGEKAFDVRQLLEKMGKRHELVRFFDDGSAEMEFVSKYS